MTAKTITVDELTKALGTMNIHIGHNSWGGSEHVDKATYPVSLAHDLFREVEKHREPLYEANAVYIDAFGDKFRYDGLNRRWHMFGASLAVGFDAPKRPLRKMVPEPETNVNTYSFRIA